MARLFTSGFGIQSTTNGHEWDTYSGNVAIATTGYRSGRSCLRVNQASGTGYVEKRWHNNNQSTGTRYIRFYLKIASAPSADTIIASAYGSSRGWNIKLTSSRYLELYSNTTKVGSTGSTQLALDTWYRIEFKDFYSSSSSANEILLDGVQEVSGSNNQSKTMSKVRIGVETSCNTDLYFDDVGIENSSYCGSGRVATLFPNGAGDSAQWNISAGSGSNYQQVDENSPDDASTYLTGASTNDLDLYNMEALTDAVDETSITSVSLVQIATRMKMGGFSAKMYHKCKEGGSTSTGSQVGTNYSSWHVWYHGGTQPCNTYQDTLSMTTKPSGGAWTESAVDSMQCGYSSQVSFGQDPDVSTLWAVVEYEGESGSVSVAVNTQTVAVSVPTYTVSTVKNVSVSPSAQVVTVSQPSATVRLGQTMHRIIVGGSPDPLDPTATEYHSIMGQSSGATWTTTEAWRQVVVPDSGILRNLTVKLSGAPNGSGKSYEFEVMKNGATTGLKVTLTNTETTGSDESTELAVAEGDLISLRCTPTGTPDAVNAEGWSMEIESDTTRQWFWTAGTGNFADNSGAESINNLHGGASWALTSSGFERRTLIPIEATIKKLYVKLSSAPTSGNAWKFWIYKNGTKVTASEIEIADTDTEGLVSLDLDISAGDIVHFAVQATTGTPTQGYVYWGVVVEPDNEFEAILAGSSGNLLEADEYAQINNVGAYVWSATEGDHIQLVGTNGFKLTNMRVHLGTALTDNGGSVEFRLRKNEANANQSVTLSGTDQDGTDASNEDTFVDGDTITMRGIPTSSPALSTQIWAFKQIPAGTFIDVNTQNVAVTAQSVTVNTGSTVSANTQNVAVGAQSPAISLPKVVAGTVAVVAVVALSVAVNFGNTQSPSTQNVAVSVPAHTLSVGNTQSVNTQNVAVSAQSPAVQLGITIQPAVQVVGVTLPQETISYGTTTGVNTQTISISVPAYTLSTGNTTAVGVQTVTVSLPTPTIITGLDVVTTPAVQVVSVSIPSSTVQVGVTLSPDVQVVTVNALSPNVYLGNTQSPNVQVVSVSVGTPAVRVGVTLTPSTQNVPVEIQTPTITAQRNIVVTPSVQVVTVDLPANILHVGVLQTPSVQTVAISIPSASVSIGHDEAVATQNVAITAQSPSLILGITQTPSAQEVAISTPTPTLSVGIQVSPAVQVVSVSIPTASVGIGVTIQPAVQTVAVSVPTYGLSVEVVVSVNTQVIGVSLPQETVIIDASVAPSTQNVPIVVNSPSVSTGALISANTQVVSVVVISPTLSVGSTLAVSTQDVVISAQAPSILGSGNISIQVAVQTVTLSIPTATVVPENIVSVNTQSVAISVPSITLQVGVALSVNTQSVAISVPSRTVDLGITISPSAQVVSISTPSPTLSVAVAPAVSVQVVSVSVPTYSISAVKNVIIGVSTQDISIVVPTYTVDTATSVVYGASAQVVAITTQTPTITVVRNITVQPSVQVISLSIQTYAIVGDFWQNKYGTDPSDITSEKYSDPSDIFSDKYSDPSDFWSNKY